MSGAAHRGFRRVQLLAEAADDLRMIAARSRPVLVEAFRLLKLLDRGEIAPTPLRDFSKTDLRDCGKILVAVDGEPEHRIVVRELGDHVDVVDVVAVEDRTHDLPYLLAGLRLGRLEGDPVRRSDAQRRVARVRRMLDR